MICKTYTGDLVLELRRASCISLPHAGFIGVSHCTGTVEVGMEKWHLLETILVWHCGSRQEAQEFNVSLGCLIQTKLRE